jgi:hypothetical protein
MPTQFHTTQGMGNSQQHRVLESVDEVTDAVNAALSTKTKFVTVTGEDGKKYAVTASTVGGIREA